MLGERRLQDPQWHFEYHLSNMDLNDLYRACLSLSKRTDPWSVRTLRAVQVAIVRRLTR